MPESATVPVAKPRVFLDSNVIFSALYSARGAPGVIMEHFVRGDITIVISQQVLEEVVRTIKEKLPAALPAFKRLLVSALPEVVADPEPTDIERWRKWLKPGDATVLAAAISAQPDYFVTGDMHFLAIRERVTETGLKVVTPVQFLKGWQKQNGPDAVA